MAETHDTIDGLLAEFRGYSYGMPPSYHVTMSWHDFRVMLDRFEAAHKRECGESVTGSNQLREALKRLDEILYIGADGEVHGALGKASEIERTIKAALAATATAEKSSAVGDAVKLREALELIVNKRGILDFCHNNLGSKKWEDWDKVYKTLRRWIDKAMSALSSPPRNCDRFATVDEARKAHEAICEKYGKCHHGCPLNNEEHYSAFDCFEAWLFAPATGKEGGDK